MRIVSEEWQTPAEIDPALRTAPHRYRWDRDEPEPKDDSRAAFLNTVPYSVGEIVYVARDGKPVRARIIGVFTERNRFEERCVKFRVQFETKAGTWSRQWYYTYPGPIQRGYALAGLAPDMPKSEAP